VKKGEPMKTYRFIPAMTLVLLVLIIPLACHGAHYNNKKCNLQFDIDKEWQVAGTAPLMFISPRGDTVLSFDVIKGDSLASALGNAEAFMARMLSDVFLGEAVPLQLNGINAVAVKGKCSIRRLPAIYKLLVLEGKGDNYGLFYYFGQPDHEKLNEAALKAFLDSIKRYR
jgi:hypothetical protein